MKIYHLKCTLKGSISQSQNWLSPAVKKEYAILHTQLKDDYPKANYQTKTLLDQEFISNYKKK